jgi:hypothetical protein
MAIVLLRLPYLALTSAFTVIRLLPMSDTDKCPRVYDWALVQTGTDHQLLVRRSIADGELAFYRCHAPAGASLRELVRGRRGPVGDRGVFPGRQERDRPG